MSSPTNLNEFALAMDKATEIYKKLTICEALVRYLKNPNSDVSLDEQGPFCLNLIQWMTSPSLKISLKALEAALEVLERMPQVLKPYVSSCFPALIERYADSKEQVRNKVHQVLMAFVDKEILTPQGLHDKLSQYGYQHKNSVVRVEALKCLMNILVMHGAKSLQLSGSTPVFLKLYCDQSEAVREEAAYVLVEIYRQVGDKLRININKMYSEDVPPQRMAALMAKFDAVRDPTLKKFQCSTGDTSLSRPESVEDFADGTSHRRVNNVSKIPSAAQSRGTSMEDLSKKMGAETRRGYGTLGRSRPASRSSASASAVAGAVDEATFRAAFLDVPAVQLYSANDLRDAIKAISVTIANSDEDWEKRVEAFRKIRSVSIAMGDHPEFSEMMKKLEIPILDALKDLRSQVVREACISIAFLAERLKSKFTYFAEFLFPSLVVLIQNSAKVMSTSALVTVRFIVENTCSLRLVSLIVNSLSSKSKDIRRAMCEILCIILSTWPVTTLEKKHPELRIALQKGIGDADPEARQLARKAFCEYKSKFPERADELLRSLDASYRRMLSEGSTESVNSTPASARAASAASARKMTTSVEKKPVFKRSNTAVDAQAVQRANVRAQYAAMHRLKAGTGTTARPPAAMPSSMANSTVGMLDDSSNRSRARAPRYSRSQPTSRSASPCAQFNYQTYQSPGSARPSISRPTGIPGPRSCASSQETSRETSPTRLGAIPKARKRLIGIGQQHPPLPLTRPALSQKMLQQSREAEYALANAFMRNETDGPRSMSGEKSSDESETSSLCERTPPCAPSALHLLNIREVLEYLNKSDWSDRKDGLFSLKYYLGQHDLSPDQLKRVTDSLTRMFMDSQTKVYTLFIETLIALIQRHSMDLDYWLYILLHKLFTKLGTDVLPTIEKKILNVLSLVRETFPLEIQIRDTFRFIVDPVQVHNTKVRMHIVKHLSQLAGIVSKSKSSMSSFEVPVKDQTAAVLSRLVKWSEIPELKECTTKCIADLFYMNAPLISNVVPQLSPDEQAVVDYIVKSSLKSFSNNKYSGTAENDDVMKSLQMTSQEIQTYRFDGLSQDSGICPLSPNSPTLTRFNLEERLAALPSPRTAPVNNSTPVRSTDSQGSDNGHSKSSEVTSYSPNNGSADLWAQIFDTLRPESNKSFEEKKEAMLLLADLVKHADADTLAPYIVKIMKRLVYILPSLEDHAATANDHEMNLLASTFACLNKLLHKRGVESQFAPFHELLALKTFNIIQNRSYSRPVHAIAEECLQTMAQVFPVTPLLEMFHNFAFDKAVPAAYAAIKGIQELVKHHSKEEFDPHFSSTMTILLLAFDSDHSAIRKAVVFCLVAIHGVYGETEMAPYLRKLDSSKRKLLDVYIQRQNKESK